MITLSSNNAEIARRNYGWFVLSILNAIIMYVLSRLLRLRKFESDRLMMSCQTTSADKS